MLAPEEDMWEALQRLFAPAREHILQLLEGSWTKFQRSPLHARMMREIGHLHMYDAPARRRALAVLREYLERERMVGLATPTVDSFAQSSSSSSSSLSVAGDAAAVQRKLLLKRMIQGFTLTMLGSDVLDSSTNNNHNSSSGGDDDDDDIDGNGNSSNAEANRSSSSSSSSSPSATLTRLGRRRGDSALSVRSLSGEVRSSKKQQR